MSLIERGEGEAIDAFAAAQSAERRAAVRLGSKAGHEKRTEILERDYADPDALRRLAGEIKQHALDHLDFYLEQACARLEERGVKVHFASDAKEAREVTLEILRQRGARRAVKAKSMVTEEIELASRRLPVRRHARSRRHRRDRLADPDGGHDGAAARCAGALDPHCRPRSGTHPRARRRGHRRARRRSECHLVHGSVEDGRCRGH